MPKDINFLIHHLSQIEEVAEEILTDKQQIVDLDYKRNKNREALRSLGLLKAQDNKKSWICLSNNMFLKFPTADCIQILEKDQIKLHEEIKNLRKNLKPKVNKLLAMEGKEELKGFDLQPLSEEEIKAIDRIL